MFVRFILFGSLLLLNNIPAKAYNIAPEQITVSGLSSGGYMAGQLQIAFSDIFSGLGLFASGVYECSRGDLDTAMQACASTELSAPSLNETLKITKDLEARQEIAPLQNLSRLPIYIFRGKHDKMISHALAEQNVAFFQNLGVPSSQISFISEIPAGHGFPTVNFGNACDTEDESPYMNQCGYDGAGEMLKKIYGHLNPKVAAIAKNMFSLAQKEKQDLFSISMGDKAFVYVPTVCQQGATCRLHVALHGCLQNIDEIEDQFYTHAGYNEWAESNQIIVLYPQAVQNMWLGNPKGCWDWWGYTGSDFANRKSPQMLVIISLINKLMTGSASHSH